MDFVVKFEDDYNVEILDKSKNCCYYIIKMDKKTKEYKNVLGKVINCGDSPADLVVPHEFPSGHRIDRIRKVSPPNFGRYKGFLNYNRFGKITISKSIKIDGCAFMYCKADEIVWPDDLFTIPAFCFLGSPVQKISNINNVTKVEKSAFAHSDIKKLSWPADCAVIPHCCFSGSKIEKIDNINNIKLIKPEAFAFSNLKVLDLSDTNLEGLDEGSLYGLPIDCDYKLPYYISKDELESSLKYYEGR